MDSRADLHEVLELLEAGFGSLSVPAEDCLVEPGSVGTAEDDQLRTLLGGRHWREIQPQELRGEADLIAFLAPESLRFYLAAFLRASLLDPKGADLITDTILWSLAPGNLESYRSSSSPGLAGVPQQLVDELTEAAVRCHTEHGGVPLDALDQVQLEAVQAYLRFLRIHRREEFVHGEVERVEEAIRDVRKRRFGTSGAP